MEPFKNWMSPKLVVCIADHLARHVAGFDRGAFEGPVLAQLGALELKPRAQLIADHIHAALPADLALRNLIIQAMLHPDEYNHIGEESDADGVCGWGTYPLAMVVGRHGMADFEGSLALLREITKRGSSEFDVRYYLIEDQARALGIIGRWTGDENLHVRRLVSEGTRPRLPWGQRLHGLVADPAPTIVLLKAMRDDPEEYVRRSIANHLNDIAKDHPDLVAEIANEWMVGADKNRARLLRHACRTLIKQGHAGALMAFGIGPPMINLDALKVQTDVVKMGGALEFSARITSKAPKPQALVIDYLVYFVKANGTRAAKVFKWKSLTIKAGEVLQLERRHPIRPITTRRYYDGTQGLSLRINGQDFGAAEFELVV